MEQFVDFSTNHATLVGSFFALLGFIVFSEYRTLTQKFSVVTPSGAIPLMNLDDSIVIDVRESNELKDGKIADTKHIPMGSISSKLKELENYKNKDVVVYCRSGHRSASACRTLTNNGFEKVYNLKGGIMAWRDAQLPIVRK
ncbi:MAG: rhodanese-like domain-containing protein [Gammaproteobacteria bacterium]|nr:rhodanese-like domain-containing protein [Gammaproteobacteria bacterium]